MLASEEETGYLKPSCVTILVCFSMPVIKCLPKTIWGESFLVVVVCFFSCLLLFFSPPPYRLQSTMERSRGRNSRQRLRVRSSGHGERLPGLSSMSFSAFFFIQLRGICLGRRVARSTVFWALPYQTQNKMPRGEVLKNQTNFPPRFPSQATLKINWRNC